MESKNHKIIEGFITCEESIQIKEWVETLSNTGTDSNWHLSQISKDLKGNSFIFDISKTKETQYITKFQSIGPVMSQDLPVMITNILERIAKKNNLPSDHVFLQAVDMNSGGKINPHYDSSIDGYINYKCNISVLSDDYRIFIDKSIFDIKERDLYCFEASLYKHWTNEFENRRIFLSFGFLIPYSVLGRSHNDPRIRLSKRIAKYLQKEETR